MDFRMKWHVNFQTAVTEQVKLNKALFEGKLLHDSVYCSLNRRKLASPLTLHYYRLIQTSHRLVNM